MGEAFHSTLGKNVKIKVGLLQGKGFYCMELYPVIAKIVPHYHVTTKFLDMTALVLCVFNMSPYLLTLRPHRAPPISARDFYFSGPENGKWALP